MRSGQPSRLGICTHQRRQKQGAPFVGHPVGNGEVAGVSFFLRCSEPFADQWDKFLFGIGVSLSRRRMSYQVVNRDRRAIDEAVPSDDKKRGYRANRLVRAISRGYKRPPRLFPPPP